MMQINQYLRFDLHQLTPRWCVVILKNRSASLVWVVILTREDGPPQYAADDHHKQQRKRQEKIKNFHNGLIFKFAPNHSHLGARRLFPALDTVAKR